MKMINNRIAGHDVNELFLKRWSPRAMSGESLSEEQLMSLFEAARWAPSSYNNQPWRFVYARRDTKQWNSLFNLLGDFNKIWAQNAAVLVVVVSKKVFDHNDKPSRTHAFDAGAAWENLALQGSLMGLAIHAMEGFDYDKARHVLKIPEEYEIQAMVAIGKLGKKDALPPDMQTREIPSKRKPVSEFVSEGVFKA